MMFLLHAALSLGLIALVAGSALYFWAINNKVKGSGFTRAIGFIVILISAISVICTLNLGIKIWKEIYYLNTMQMHDMQMKNADQSQTNSSAPAAKSSHHRK